mgnify:CR=1 FL=1
MVDLASPEDLIKFVEKFSKLFFILPLYFLGCGLNAALLIKPNISFFLNFSLDFLTSEVWGKEPIVVVGNKGRLS